MTSTCIKSLVSEMDIDIENSPTYRAAVIALLGRDKGFNSHIIARRAQYPLHEVEVVIQRLEDTQHIVNGYLQTEYIGSEASDLEITLELTLIAGVGSGVYATVVVPNPAVEVLQEIEQKQLERSKEPYQFTKETPLLYRDEDGRIQEAEE